MTNILKNYETFLQYCFNQNYNITTNPKTDSEPIKIKSLNENDYQNYCLFEHYKYCFVYPDCDGDATYDFIERNSILKLDNVLQLFAFKNFTYTECKIYLDKISKLTESYEYSVQQHANKDIDIVYKTEYVNLYELYQLLYSNKNFLKQLI